MWLVFKKGLPMLAGAFLGLMSLSAVAAGNYFHIAHFSDDYHATVEVTDNFDSVDKEGEIRVFNNQDQRLIKQHVNGFYIDEDAVELSANVQVLPYGEQSLLIYEDVNFDGRKDLVLRNGHMGCYGGPSYDVYLAGANHDFTHSDAFTEIASSYCGLFVVDEDAQQLHAMSKSGCCEHFYDTYQVQDNKPVLHESRTELVVGAHYLEHHITTINGDHKDHSTQLYWFDEGGEDKSSVLLKFALQDYPQQQIIVFANYDTVFGTDVIDIVRVKGKTHQVLLSAAVDHQSEADQQKDMREVASYAAPISVQPGQLSFVAADKTYTVVNHKQQFGLRIRSADGERFLAGKAGTRHGSLQRLNEHKFDNLQRKEPAPH